jgi:hypothetical protein
MILEYPSSSAESVSSSEDEELVSDGYKRLQIDKDLKSDELWMKLV